MLGKNLIQAAAGNAGAAGYQIERSLRFNSADSAYLSRTNGTSTDEKKFTLSFWMKRNTISTATGQWIFSGGNSAGTDTLIGFNASSDALQFANSAVSADGQTTTMLFRDVSSWYHVVIVGDSTQGSNADRIKFYVNGVQQATSITGTIALNSTFNWNKSSVAVNIGRYTVGGSNYANLQFTEIHNVDGQALTPSSFGETDATTGVWKPKAYAGTYGTNGFYLNFSDNSNTTAATLGADSSGNGNNWTPNNFSVAAGVGNDSLVDTPTPYGSDTGAGGEVRGNYATLNPLYYSTQATITNGNLDLQTTSGGRGTAFSTMAVSSGKFYAEFYIASGTGYSRIGVMRTDVAYAETSVFTSYDGGVGYVDVLGGIYDDTGALATSIGTSTTGDTIGVALNMDDGELSIYKNGSLLSTVSPHTLSEGGSFYFAVSDSSTSAASSYNVNFGQRPFAYTAPSGFKALCTQNLPTPSVVDGGDYFNTVLWTGDGSYPRSITNVGFAPDLVWAKVRNTTYDHIVYDAVRGTGTSKSLYTNQTYNEGYSSTYANLSSFDSDGFTIGSTASVNVLNNTSDTFVAWNWNAGGSNATNTDGSITSTVRANTTAGFSIVSYTGNGTAGATVGHGLGATPAMLIVKVRSASNNWVVYHQANTTAPETDYLYLNLTNGTADSTTQWNDTAPTTSVFSLGTSTLGNGSGSTYIAYCFAEVEGYSKFGSYTGNGSADGPFVFTNHKPAFVMIKRTDSTSNWTILDLKREGYNVDNDPLYPNLSNAEGTTDLADIFSNGFKLRSTDASVNASGGTYIYISLASNPFKFSLAR